jgi:hypothetical protein
LNLKNVERSCIAAFIVLIVCLIIFPVIWASSIFTFIGHGNDLSQYKTYYFPDLFRIKSGFVASESFSVFLLTPLSMAGFFLFALSILFGCTLLRKKTLYSPKRFLLCFCSINIFNFIMIFLFGYFEFVGETGYINLKIFDSFGFWLMYFSMYNLIPIFSSYFFSMHFWCLECAEKHRNIERDQG